MLQLRRYNVQTRCHFIGSLQCCQPSSTPWEITYGYTGCNTRNGPDFGRVFLMLNYTEKPQNTYIQSWTFWEIMAIENCGLLSGPRTIAISWHSYLLVGQQQAGVSRHHQYSSMMYSTSNRKYKYDTYARNFAVTIYDSMSLTSYFDEKYRY